MGVGVDQDCKEGAATMNFNWDGRLQVRILVSTKCFTHEIYFLAFIYTLKHVRDIINTLWLLQFTFVRGM